jgi:hypothetical protein
MTEITLGRLIKTSSVWKEEAHKDNHDRDEDRIGLIGRITLALRKLIR